MGGEWGEGVSGGRGEWGGGRGDTLSKRVLFWNSFFMYLKKTNSSAPRSCYSPEHLWTVLKLPSS